MDFTLFGEHLLVDFTLFGKHPLVDFTLLGEYLLTIFRVKVSTLVHRSFSLVFGGCYRIMVF